ncbi:MAG TPA: zf-HC2 domain-containing protein [Polyangium sp.]|nr:zf-HC2 domain-containing protein [Polyangium sp.]
MRPVLTRTRAETCLSDLRLDRLVARELDAADERETRAHLEGCARCTARLATIEADRAAFLADPPPLPAVRPVAKVPRLARWAPRVAAMVVAAAALVLWFRARPAGEDPDDPATRIKGHPRVGFYVKRGAAVTPGAAGEVVYPGDLLQFTYTMQRDAAYFALISVDGARKASVYYPSTPRAVRIPQGSDVPLDQSTMLDAIVGPETAYALFCADPIELEPVRAAFEAAPDSPPIPAGCEVDRVSFVKRQAP